MKILIEAALAMVFDSERKEQSKGRSERSERGIFFSRSSVPEKKLRSLRSLRPLTSRPLFRYA
jgi:hypothetical protein